MFKDITVAVDGSDHARNALEIACDIAKLYEGNIHLVHTPEVQSTGIAVGSGAVEILPTDAAIQDAGHDVMADAVKRARAAGCEAKNQIIGNGRPSTEVIAAAKDTGSDLIVMGRRGLGGVQSFLMGSTSQKIAHDAPCAVLTVK